MVAAPGSLTAEQEIQQLKRRLDDLTRAPDVFPVCRVRFNGSTGLGAGDTFAQGGWTAFEDPQNMFSVDGSGYARITIGVTGYYQLHYHSSLTGPTSGFAVGRIALNSPNFANSIAADSALFPTSGSADGATPDAFRLRIKLNAGDVLYWGNYTSVACTLNGVSIGVPTEVAVMYVNARSS